MENCYALFRVALMLNVLILVVSFTGVTSAPVTPSITQVMKNDTNLCETSKLLYDSNYTKSCASLPYPDVSLDYTDKTLDTFLCLGVYDTAYKICQYSSQPSHIPSFNTADLIPYVEKFVSNANLTQRKEFCNNLQGFTTSYNKTDVLLKSLVESLNVSHKCQKICFDINDKVNPLCAVFAWIKKFDDIKKANKTETKHEFVTSDKSFMTQSNEMANNRMVEVKNASGKGTNEQITNKDDNDNIVEKANLHFVPENVSPTVHVESDTAEKSNTGKPSKAQKKDDASLTKTNVEIANPIKNTPANSNLQISSMNNPADNVPKKDTEEKGEKFNKEQIIADLKPSTLSEHTQDQYDVGNPEEDNVDNIEDVDDTIQQSTRNQNENVQEEFEQKNLRYSNIRTEDDSHFFTYFTVIIVACIAGYIGYHNKQKILAIVLEGRRSRNNRGRRRPSTANYRKLDCTLEEAVTSQCNTNVTHVIY